MGAPRITVDDLVAAFPAVIGYQPSEGDVGFALVTARREVYYWRNLDERTYGTANLKPDHREMTFNARAAVLQADWIRLGGGAGGALLVGYGAQGVTNVAALRDELAMRDICAEACAVVGNSWGDLAPGRDRVDQWYALPHEPHWLPEYLGAGGATGTPFSPNRPGPHPDPPADPHPSGPGL